MAWRSSGTTNASLISNLAANGLIKSPRVKTAMLNVDRAHYTLSPQNAYQDSPQSIGHSATISAPHMHASACESLLPQLTSTSRVLDIGSGSGYLTHVLANLTAPGGVVVGVEHIPELVELARGNMRKSAEGRELLETGRVKFVVGDGRKGWMETGEGGGDGESGWDAIHVGAGARKIHEALVKQLRRGGRMFIPVDDHEEERGQHIWIVDKGMDGVVLKESLYGVSYVPLTDGPS